MDVRRRLPGHPRSASLARRTTEETLTSWGLEPLLDDARLLVSELVTNAILHAASDVELRFVRSNRSVRVEVHDAAASMPSTREGDDESVTGRGLKMVALLAARTGALPTSAGKVVWFELDLPGVAPPEGGSPQAITEGRIQADGWDPFDLRQPTGPRGQEVQLRGVPVQLFRATQQHSDALLRETVIAHLGHDANAASAPSSLAPALGYDGADIEEQLRRADENGRPGTDLTLHLPEEAGDAARNLMAALDLADEAARREMLLIPAALPEVRAHRRWFLGEVAAQLAGDGAVPWTPTEGLDSPTDLLADVGPDTVLDQLGDGVVLADDQNRIIYLNPAAERLLGWERAELVGQRVTTIVPPRLRDAHVAGYSNYLLSGESRLLGTPVRVPALHRSGAEVPVELVLKGFTTDDGRQLFTASMRDLTDRVELERKVNVANAFRAAAEVVAALAASGKTRTLVEAAPVLLPAVGERLGWQFGAMWVPSGEQLACAEVWTAGPGLDAFAQTTAQRRFSDGEGLPGRVWSSAEPTWVTDVVVDANFPRARGALAAGLRTAFAFPILGQGAVLGVLEFYSIGIADPDHDLLTMAGTIGRLVGLLVA